EVIVAVANDGVAGVPGVLRLTLVSDDGRIRISGCLDAGHPFGGKLRQAAFQLPAGAESHLFRLEAAIETKNGVVRPVRWACAQRLNGDGSYPITLKPHTDPYWRKNV
ncbi:MAG: hypothetical protein ABFE01_17360, partial [Phycisphaerales bacterium]